MKLRSVVGFLAFLLMTSGLSSQTAHVVTPNTSDSWNFRNGNDLLSDCEKDHADAGYAVCLSYIMGAVDVIGSSQGTVDNDFKSYWKLPSVCMPTDVTMQQVVDVVVKNLKENPETRTDSASWIIVRALEHAWACPAK